MKTLIVGGGIMGLATAWGLAREGHDVELFEQGPLPNPLGSSCDQHRLIRHPYGDHVGYARMIDDAYAAWSLLWSDLGVCHHAPTGTLALTGNGETWADRSAGTLAAIGKPMAALGGTELARRFPHLDVEGVERAFWIDTGGVLFAQDIVHDLARHLAGQPRVTLRPETKVRSVDMEGARLVTAAGSEHAADCVVVSAGAWVNRLLPATEARLVPSRQIVVYFELPVDQLELWAKSPMIIEGTGDVGLYLVPPVEGRGLKVGDHEFSRSGDPDASRDASLSELGPLLGRCRSSDSRLRAMAHRGRESLLLHRDQGRAFRGREARSERLADVALLGPRLQVRRADGTGAGPHDRPGARPRPPRALGGRAGRRNRELTRCRRNRERMAWLPASEGTR